MNPSDISVVIPAINEEHEIGPAIVSAKAAGAGEVIVVDGGSTDGTVQRVKEAGATKVVRSFPGRGIQLNAGAALVDSGQQIILFLHADNRLSQDCLKQICRESEVIWGAFEHQISAEARIYRLIEWGNALRVRCRRMPFGDQAIFVTKSWFERQGGFDELPLMEDVEFSSRMRRIARPRLLPGPLTVSARRWHQRGAIRQTLRNWKIQLAFCLGVRAHVLKKWYR